MLAYSSSVKKLKLYSLLFSLTVISKTDNCQIIMSFSNGYIFPFLLCFLLPFFSQLFVRSPQTAILLFCISFSWRWSWFLSPVQCHEPPSIVHQVLCLLAWTILVSANWLCIRVLCLLYFLEIKVSSAPHHVQSWCYFTHYSIN